MSLIDNSTGKFLYKYLPFNQYSLQILINQKFWLGPPDLLNDPFEGDFIIKNFKKFHNKQCIETLIELTKSDSKYDVIFNDYIYNELINDEDQFLNKLFEYLNIIIKKNYGTTSFSKRCDDLKMWSHYADSHKGFVIIFDRKILETTIVDGITKLIDVEYNGLPSINLDYDSNNFNIRDYGMILTKKLSDWNNEDEVRIIKKHEFAYDFQRFLKFKRESIKGIIYGSRISFENLMTIDNILVNSNQDLKFYVGKKNSERNKIIFNEIIYKK